ncbi:MAG: hypothetical protein AAFO89_03885, partial [Planctomycetota bacterium]
RPWWVWHDAPDGTDAETDSRLIEVEAGHWVRVWSTAGVRDAGDRLGSTQPSLATRRRPAGQRGDRHAMPAAH